MRAGWATLTVAALLFCATDAGAAEMYKCKDAKGSISFSDSPCPVGDSTVDRKVTSDTSTLGKQPARSRSKDGRGDDKPAPAAAAAAAPAASGDSGCQKQRERYARMQSESCIKGIHMLTGKVSCMSDQQRREYLENFKSTLEAVCS